jgi:hypothetical protein
MKIPVPIDAAIREAKILVTVLKTLGDLPDDESRARVMAMVSTKCGLYEEAIEFNRAARAAATRKAAVAAEAELADDRLPSGR